jgi:DNA-binding CsgD family transcriptional regulator
LTLERVRRDVEVLAHAGLSTETFLAEVYESLQRAVPADAACVATLDPASGLATGAVKLGELAQRNDTDELWGQLEYGEVESTSFTELARVRVTAIGMHAATGGDPRRSQRVQHLVMSALGCTDELRVLATDARGLWGGMALFRQDTTRPYGDTEIEFMGSLSAFLAGGLRTAILARLAADPPAAQCGPAVMVFDRLGRLRESSLGTSRRFGAALEAGDGAVSPAVIASHVAAAWRYAAGATDVLPSSRLRLQSGEWVVVHAAPLAASDGTTSSVVVTIEEARPPEIVPLVVAAFDLTPRERDVTQHVLQGVDTRDIATALHLSPLTVQDHLKSIFSKTGTNSRRELVARVFFDQYVPRIGSHLSPSGWFAPSG